MKTDELLARQLEQLVWLTNGIGEVSHATPELLIKAGLDSGVRQGQWYPLTGPELKFVSSKGGSGFWMPSGFLAVTACTALHKGRKWVTTDVEYTDDVAFDDDALAKELLSKMTGEADAIRPAIEAAGGLLFLLEDTPAEGHTLSIAFPMAEAVKRGTVTEFAEWVRQVVGGKPWN